MSASVHHHPSAFTDPSTPDRGVGLERSEDRRARGVLHAIHVLWYGVPNRWEFKDDLGAIRPPWKPNVFTLRAVRSESLSSAEYRSLRRRIATMSKSSRVKNAAAAGFVFSIVLSIAHAVVVSTLIGPVVLSPLERVIEAVALWSVVFLVGFLVWRGLGGNPRHALRGLRSMNRCGCAQDLSRVRPGADGMICCPECGARWKAPERENPSLSEGRSR